MYNIYQISWLVKKIYDLNIGKNFSRCNDKIELRIIQDPVMFDNLTSHWRFAFF